MIDSIPPLVCNPGILLILVESEKPIVSRIQSTISTQVANKVSFVMTNEYAYFFPHLHTQDRRPPPKQKLTNTINEKRNNKQCLLDFFV